MINEVNLREGAKKPNQLDFDGIQNATPFPMIKRLIITEICYKKDHSNLKIGV